MSSWECVEDPFYQCFSSPCPWRFCVSLRLRTLSSVSSATGRAGSFINKALKEQDVNVRGFIRNVTKTRERLRRVACDASEGSLVGDVTDPSTLIAPMVGAHSLIIATGAPLVCPDVTDFSKCYYPCGDLPIDVDFNGRKYQLDALAEASHGLWHVVLISSMGATVPNSPLNKFGYGQFLFYEMNLETGIMSSGLMYVIVKPCGLTMAEGGQKELIVGHDDMMTVMPNSIAWADVASLCVWRLFRAQVCALTCAPRGWYAHIRLQRNARRNAVSEPCVTRRRERSCRTSLCSCAQSLVASSRSRGSSTTCSTEASYTLRKKAWVGQARLKARCGRLPSGRTEQHQHRTSWSSSGSCSRPQTP